MPVVITDSAGYEGTVNEPQWSDLLAMSGGRQYGVGGPDDWDASIGGADREVRLSPGRGFGYGVRDRTTAEASIVLPSATAGSVWHLIVVHRDWQANRSQFDSIAGGSSRALPQRSVTPGEQDDQPLWLARVDAGRSQVQELIDLRSWGGDGGSFARDALALQFLNRVGTQIVIGSDEWVRVRSVQGVPEWQRRTAYPVVGHLGMTGAFQTLSPNRVEVLMPKSQILRGGMTHAGNRLVVPETALYRIRANFYQTSGGAQNFPVAGYVNWGGADQLTAALYKGAHVYDLTAYIEAIKEIPAGSAVGLVMTGPTNSYTWGVNGYSGTFLELEKV